MNRVLEDIECIPGVSGACFYSTQKGIISQKISHEKAKQSIGSVAKILAKMYTGGMESYGNVEKISLKFNEMNFIITMITEKIFLIIIHDEEVNTDLLGLTISENVKSLKAHISKNDGTKIVAHPAHSDRSPPKSGNQLSIETAIKAEPVTQTLCAMEKMLNKVMGPMASIVFNDTLQTWIKDSREQDSFSIDKLACLLFEEINDPEKIVIYKAMIDPHLKPIREHYHAHST
ncbi:hypothetical protein [Desulforegula conservatrix]|uniref:hypothetical protein n=1 Tax=Desulforegula conservatrix TaxID=153026 RepID=UPI0003F6113D|nr:hypothetical protein [Desulforegula conservatrix]